MREGRLLHSDAVFIRSFLRRNGCGCACASIMGVCLRNRQDIATLQCLARP